MPETETRNFVILLDTSNSMANDGKLDAVKEQIPDFLRSEGIRDCYEKLKFGLIIFGVRHRGDIENAIKIVYEPEQQPTVDEVISKIEALEPQNQTPLYLSIKKGVELVRENGFLFVVTDGIEYFAHSEGHTMEENMEPLKNMLESKNITGFYISIRMDEEGAEFFNLIGRLKHQSVYYLYEREMENSIVERLKHILGEVNELVWLRMKCEEEEPGFNELIGRARTLADREENLSKKNMKLLISEIGLLERAVSLLNNNDNELNDVITQIHKNRASLQRIRFETGVFTYIIFLEDCIEQHVG